MRLGLRRRALMAKGHGHWLAGGLADGSLAINFRVKEAWQKVKECKMLARGKRKVQRRPLMMGQGLQQAGKQGK